MKRQKNCESCGILFEGKSKRKKYCSKTCGSRYYDRLRGASHPDRYKEYLERVKNQGIGPLLHTRNCGWCGKEIKVYRTTKYCDLKCRGSYYNVSRRTKNPKEYEEYLERSKMKIRRKVRERLGIPLDTPKLTNNGRGWKEKDGYKYLLRKEHPNSAKSGYVAEHVFIVSNNIGRPLTKKETVHHKNGIRNDNRIENLELWSSDHPSGQRVEDKIKWCKEFIALYDKDNR